jgi:hypothetical protein
MSAGVRLHHREPMCREAHSDLLKRLVDYMEGRGPRTRRDGKNSKPLG